MRTLRVGTRRSALALRQTELTVAELLRADAAARVEIVPISTEGDERSGVSLRELGGTGAFVKRIEQALLSCAIDLAVHSLKDVPTALEPGLTLAAIPRRGDPRDALVATATHATGPGPWPELAPGARVGTGSARRAAQLLQSRPDLTIADIRGNVDTRLRKLDDGEVDALVLAAAGLARLGRLERLTRLLEPNEMLPMVGQGALAVEARMEDEVALALASRIDNPATRACVEAERTFLSALGGGCTLPVGALALVDGAEVWLRVAVADQDGQRIARREGRASVAASAKLAERLAAEVLPVVRMAR